MICVKCNGLSCNREVVEHVKINTDRQTDGHRTKLVRKAHWYVIQNLVVLKSCIHSLNMNIPSTVYKDNAAVCMFGKPSSIFAQRYCLEHLIVVVILKAKH